jgi:uncharacterized protein YjbI with pentapeptide repeats
MKLNVNGQKYKIKPYVNLEGVNLEGMNLQAANLEGANLRNANLRFTILRNANLCNAILEGVNLEGANLEGVNLEGANLEGFNLRKINLRSANLRNANLRNAILEGAILQGAILKNANLEDANLECAALWEADLSFANLRNSNLLHTNLLYSNLDGVNLENATMPDGAIYGSVNTKTSSSTSKSPSRSFEQVNQVPGKGKEKDETKLFLCDGIDFSHVSGVPFSLKNEMSNAGFRDIGDFFRQITKIVEDPTVLVDLSRRIANEIDKDYFRVVVARLLNAVSYNSAIVEDADIEKWLVAAELAEFGMSSQRRLSEPFFNIVHRVVINSIRTYGLQGLEIVRQLEVGAIAWEQVSEGKSVFGDDSDAARSLLVAVVLQSVLHSLKSAQSSQHVIESLSGTKGQNVSLREELRMMTELGRQYARANGINYDDFVRRHAGIE